MEALGEEVARKYGEDHRINFDRPMQAVTYTDPSLEASVNLAERLTHRPSALDDLDPLAMTSESREAVEAKVERSIQDGPVEIGEAGVVAPGVKVDVAAEEGRVRAQAAAQAGEIVAEDKLRASESQGPLELDLESTGWQQ